MDASSRFVVAIDLGGTHLRAAIVDEAGTIHFRVKQRTPVTTAPGEIVRALAGATRECQSHCLSADSIRAISIAIPGTADPAGSIVQIPNLACLNGFPLTEALSGELKLPVILENDANAAAVGEVWRGAARDRRTVVCLTLGTGVGSGIILEGKLWRGANGVAAEIGHICVDPAGKVACKCGSRGCLEVYASATAIVRMAREARPGYANSCLPASGELTAEEVHAAGVKRDELALEVFRCMGDYLGVAIVNLIVILNPEMIVIGGGGANGWDLFAGAMNQRIAERTFPRSAFELAIVPAECGDDAGLLGAARLGFDYLSRTHSSWSKDDLDLAKGIVNDLDQNNFARR